VLRGERMLSGGLLVRHYSLERDFASPAIPDNYVRLLEKSTMQMSGNTLIQLGALPDWV
jgi:hypothetical protein